MEFIISILSKIKYLRLSYKEINYERNDKNICTFKNFNNNYMMHIMYHEFSLFIFTPKP